MGMPYDYGPLYWTYSGMKARCYNRNHPRYPEWGGRGIRVCERWLERVIGFANFCSDMGERPQGYQLDRIDNDGPYSPENCRWASPSLNSYNRKKRQTNTSGVTGVNWHKSNKKWHATITVNKYRHNLGFYEIFDEAVNARKLAELRLM